MATQEPYRAPLAVLTGDIVRSSTLDAAEFRRLTSGIEGSVGAFERVYPGSMIGAADIYRGDSWQIAMAKPRLGLRFAMYLRAVVKSRSKTDTRVSIAIGSGDRLNTAKISQSTGETFTRSGRELDSIGSRRLVLSMEGNDLALLSGTVAMLLDRIASGWSTKQAEAMCRVLENPGKSDADIAGAGASDSDRRNFSKLKMRANADAILDALSAFEALSIWDGND